MYSYMLYESAEGDETKRELFFSKPFSFYEFINAVYLNDHGLDSERPLDLAKRRRLNQVAFNNGFQRVSVHRNYKTPVEIWSASKTRVLDSFNKFKQLQDLLSNAPRKIEIFPHGFTDTNLWGDLTLVINTNGDEERFLMTYFAQDVFRLPRYAKLVTEGDLFHDPELDWDTHLIPVAIRKPSEYVDIVREWLEKTFPKHGQEHELYLYHAY